MKIEPIKLRNWQSGLVDSVPNSSFPTGGLTVCNNCFTDETNGNKWGNVQGSPGYAIINTAVQADKDILGLGNLNSSTPRLVAAVNDLGDSKAQTFYDTGSAWAEIGTTPTDWTKDEKIRFEPFLGYLFAGNQTDGLKSWDGTPTNDWGATNLTSAPSSGNLIKAYNAKLYVAGDTSYPSRVWSSNVVASNAITWSTTGYIGVDHNDSMAVTALEVSGSILLIFKQFSMFTYNGEQTQAQPLFNVGTMNQEVVQTVKGTTFFFGEHSGSGSAFSYKGNYPEDITRPIRGWINSIATSAYSSFGSWSDEDNYYLSVGDVTYQDGITYSNVVLRRNVSKQTWSTLTLADQPIISTKRQDDSNNVVVIGDTDGTVYTWNSGTTYNGSDINSSIRTTELEFGSRVTEKTINKFAVYSEFPQGATIKVRIDGGKWETLARLTKEVEIVTKQLKGHWFEFEITCSNTGDPFVFGGLEFFDEIIEKYPL